MKILIMTPGAVGYKSPTLLVAEELQRRGNEVTVVLASEPMHLVQDGDYDVIFGDMERACIPAYLSALILDIPCYLHGEWVPEFRVKSTSRYGASCTLLPSETKKWGAFYRPIAAVMQATDICSWASPIFQKGAEELLGSEYTNAFTRFTRLPSDAPKSPIPIGEAENIPVICSRLAPIKRVPMLVEAVGKMDESVRPKEILIVGDGPEKGVVSHMAKMYGLVVRYATNVHGPDKWDAISRGRVMLSAWTGIPPGEALMCGRPTIAFDMEHIRELYGDTLIYTPNNDIDAMTRVLNEHFGNDVSFYDKFALRGREALLNGKIGLQTFERGVDEIEQTLRRIIQ